MGFSWSFALTAVLAEGILFLILTKTGLRESIINGMPGSLNHAIVAGLGLFIVTIGLENAGLVVTDSGLLLPNPDPISSEILVAFFGLSITIALMYFKVRGALLIGIVVTTLIGIPFDVTTWYGGGLKPQMPYLFSFAFSEVAGHFLDFLLITATLTLTDLFEEVGTLQGCLGITNLVRKDGTITDCKQALYADTAGKLIAAVLGTSSMTIYVESASGVAAGGRTGLTSVVTAALFFLSLLLSPLFLSIPSAATAPVLIIVGMMMAAPFKKIKFSDPIEAIPAILCILVMVFTFSIFKGIAVGVISYVLLKLISGRRREITPIVWVTLILVLIKFLIALFGKNG